MEISWDIDNFLVETSWVAIGSVVKRPTLAAMEVLGEDTSYGAEEGRETWCPVPSFSSGTLVLAWSEVTESRFEASEMFETKEKEVCLGVDISGDSVLTSWAHRPPKKRRSRVISMTTDMSRSWDLRVEKWNT